MYSAPVSLKQFLLSGRTVISLAERGREIELFNS
jgi:hypothetical protein